ncbi:hypothetical protein LCGC14_0102240 [marine sediment metagenome]|uniref:Uncharacterized protein n=1 Tax=marine sediment metagenome TaxID=412755 RepID=A0A0F9VFH1_9ZZZZ
MRWWQAEVLCNGVYVQPYTDGRVRISTILVIYCKFQAPNSKAKALRKARRVINSKKKGHFRNDEITEVHYIRVKRLFKKDYPRENEFLVTIEDCIWRIFFFSR